MVFVQNTIKLVENPTNTNPITISRGKKPMDIHESCRRVDLTSHPSSIIDLILKLVHPQLDILEPILQLRSSWTLLQTWNLELLAMRIQNLLMQLLMDNTTWMCLRKIL